MPTNVNLAINGRTDMVRVIRELQAYLGQSVNSSIDDQAIGQQVVKLQKYLSTVPSSSTPSGYKFDPAKVRSYLGDMSLIEAIIELQNAVNASDLAFFTNFSASTTSKMRAGFAAQQAGTRDMVVAIMGDSTDRGVDETALPFSFQYPLSFAEQLAIQCRANGVAASADNWYGISGNNLQDYDDRDARITTGGTAAMGSSVVQGGAGLSMSSATATMSFTPKGNFNTAKISTLQNAAFNGATLAVFVDGVFKQNIVQDATNTIRKTIIDCGAVGQHTITINWVSGANALYGIECYDNTKKQIIFRQWAQSGATVSQMIDNTGSPAGGRINQLNLDPADLVIGDLGVVNSWRNGTAVATVKAQAETIIDAIIAAGGDFIFTEPPFDSGSAGNTVNQQQYVDAITASCIAKGCAVMNTRAALGSKATSDALGYTSPSDFVHYRINGQAYRAQIFVPGLISKVEMPAKLALLRDHKLVAKPLVVMASPPTITMNATPNANSSVVPANYDAKYTATNTLFTYVGGVVATQASSGPPGAFWAKGAGSNYGTGNGYQGTSSVYFKTSDADVDLSFVAQNNIQCKYRISIDLFDGNGLRATALAPRNDIELLGDYSGHHVKIANGSVAMRGYRIEFENFLFFAGVDVAGTIQQWAPYGPTILVVGDSHVAGTGATSNLLGMAHKLKEELGVHNVLGQGQGGTGLLTTTTAGTETMRARIPGEITPRNPDLIIDLSGFNDQAPSPSALQTEMGTYQDALAAALPNVPYIKVGSPRRGISTGAGFTPTQSRNDAIKAGALAHSRYGKMNFFIDSWLLDYEHGTGRVGATTGDGNADTWITGDNVHHTDVGHAGFAGRLGPDVRTALGIG